LPLLNNVQPVYPIALGRLSPAKAADAFFTLICPEFYCPDSQSHLAAQSANSCDWVSFRLPAPARGRRKIWGNILTMPANWAEKNAVYKLIICINKYKLTTIILNLGHTFPLFAPAAQWLNQVTRHHGAL
jgi:hypothetical protein